MSTPAFPSMLPHHHSHDRHPHPQQKWTGPGTPKHMRAGDCGREARGDREREWEWGCGGREKNGEENELPWFRCESFFWVIFLPPLGLAVLLCILGPICDDGGCVSAYIATAHRSQRTPARFTGSRTRRRILRRELRHTPTNIIHFACLGRVI
ncbi:hypothetical protein B0H13DRAFT_2478943 [Mycena leptocephala]|nr:hypothetical protein B0H13DRAFT_2478943 [Mycena leptocephala]